MQKGEKMLKPLEQHNTLNRKKGDPTLHEYEMKYVLKVVPTYELKYIFCTNQTNFNCTDGESGYFIIYPVHIVWEESLRKTKSAVNETAKIQIFRLFPTTYAKIKTF